MTTTTAARPAGGADALVRWADAQWIHVPRRLIVRRPGLRGLAGDGHVVVTVPVVAAVLPGACLLLGLLTGLLRLGYDVVYTESVVLLALLVGIGFFSSQLGVLAVAGFCVGDLISAERYQGTAFGSGWFGGPLGQGPLASVVHGFLPLLITYLLLVAGVVLLPRAARAVVLTVGRGRTMPPVLAWGLVSGLVTVIAWLGTDAWVAAAPTLIRPVFTWASPGGAPTVEAVATLQETGGVVVAAAVVATLLRQLWLGAAMLPGAVQARLRAAEDGTASGAAGAPGGPTAPAADVGPGGPAAHPAPGGPDAAPRLAVPGPARRIGGALLSSLLGTLTMAGILEQAWLWVAAFGVLLAVRLLRTTERYVPALERWRRIAAVLPAWARLIALWLLSRVAVSAVSNDLIGSYSALGVFVLLSIVVVFAVFPGDPKPAPDAPAEPAREGAR